MSEHEDRLRPWVQAANRIDLEFMGDRRFEALYRIVDPEGYLQALCRLGRDEEAEALNAELDWRGDR